MSTEMTVIVTAHNRAGLVDKTLATLAEQRWDGNWDILLVDNASTDNTVEVLHRWVEKMPVPTRVMHADERPNVCYVRNTAAASCDSTSVVFIDDDDLLGEGFVGAMAEALRVHEFVGANRELGLLNSDEEAAWRGGDTKQERNELYGVPIVPGGGCGARRELWQRLGGNDEQLGYGAEDAALSIDAHLAGVDIAFVDEAVYHVRHRSTAGSAYRQGAVFAEGHVILAERHREALDIRPDSFGRLLRNWAGLFLRLPMVFDPARRPLWMWQLGRRVGRLRASVSYRTWYP